MKRFIIMAAVALGVSATAVADNNVNAKDWTISLNVAKLGKYLDLTSNQYNDVENITTYFSDKMYSAYLSKDAKQTKKLREAVYGNFKLMKEALSDAQYKKYLYLMNVTLRNKGLDSYIESLPQE
jgi:hypothetical protein